MPGNIKFLCELASPDVVGLINVGTAHLGIFGSIENLLATKLEIFRNSPHHAIQVAFHDDPRILENARKTGKKTLTFGVSPDASVSLVKSEWLSDGSMAVELRLPDRDNLKIQFGIAHEVFPLNAAAAVALALAAGTKKSALADGLNGFRGVKGRYYLYRKNGLTIVDDSYNANPESMAAGLATLGRAYHHRDIVLVLGDMLELGSASSQAHYQIGQKLPATLKPRQLITVGPESRQIAAGARAAGFKEQAIASYDTVEELIAADIDWQALGQVLYAKGSNGVKLSKLIDKLTSD
jgi:UDP-N-acetylmuramoyl-tripeptide--D-alanyl-D-alanine ligase